MWVYRGQFGVYRLFHRKWIDNRWMIKTLHTLHFKDNITGCFQNGLSKNATQAIFELPDSGRSVIRSQTACVSAHGPRREHILVHTTKQLHILLRSDHRSYASERCICDTVPTWHRASGGSSRTRPGQSGNSAGSGSLSRPAYTAPPCPSPSTKTNKQTIKIHSEVLVKLHKYTNKIVKIHKWIPGTRKTYEAENKHRFFLISHSCFLLFPSYSLLQDRFLVCIKYIVSRVNDTRNYFVQSSSAHRYEDLLGLLQDGDPRPLVELEQLDTGRVVHGGRRVGPEEGRKPLPVGERRRTAAVGQLWIVGSARVKILRTRAILPTFWQNVCVSTFNWACC